VIVGIPKKFLAKDWEDEGSRCDYKNKKEKPSRGSWFLFLSLLCYHTLSLRNLIWQENGVRTQRGTNLVTC